MFMIGFLLTAAVIGGFGLLIGAAGGYAFRPKQNYAALSGAIGGFWGGIFFLSVGTAFSYTVLPQRTVHTEFGEATIPEISEEKLIPRLWAFGLLGTLPGFVLAVRSIKA